MTIISKVNRGAPIPCPHFKMRINPLEKKAIFISKREAIRHFEKKGINHFERTGLYHFKTTVLPVINLLSI